MQLPLVLVLCALVSVFAADSLDAASFAIATDLRNTMEHGLTRNNTAAATQPIQESPMLSDAEMARVWATAHNGGLSVLSGISVYGSIALDLQSIATHGLTPTNGASFLTNVQLAIDLGTLTNGSTIVSVRSQVLF
ncbi:hypothetical protein SPRG_15486 [Saprolegnia parasitica CBS 223.65]|uniref:SCP domain-containing protein n=1 Tax=Saprolegnia parasitica (strain CBS 223.65) TaxID=695850 RepID=A0A067BYL0_SAPPC|nr:hypothetical protein SPRG_15486 [Saprolegnia parasitica CBS 223.65]KDO19406.1 hypothetical protein SPRG_15486 [Saprolegnia parasitica CBS 223.65]|eukprot:XP_012209873.1 hypothetical protein SPRG_15486 [Saprolegnia parasitica CBS 223.65]